MFVAIRSWSASDVLEWLQTVNLEEKERVCNAVKANNALVTGQSVDGSKSDIQAVLIDGRALVSMMESWKSKASLALRKRGYTTSSLRFLFPFVLM